MTNIGNYRTIYVFIFFFAMSIKSSNPCITTLDIGIRARKCCSDSSCLGCCGCTSCSAESCSKCSGTCNQCTPDCPKCTTGCDGKSLPIPLNGYALQSSPTYIAPPSPNYAAHPSSYLLSLPQQMVVESQQSVPIVQYLAPKFQQVEPAVQYLSYLPQQLPSTAQYVIPAPQQIESTAQQQLDPTLQYLAVPRRAASTAQYLAPVPPQLAQNPVLLKQTAPVFQYPSEFTSPLKLASQGQLFLHRKHQNHFRSPELVQFGKHVPQKQPEQTESLPLGVKKENNTANA